MHIARAVTVGVILLILANVKCLSACAVKEVAPAPASPCRHHGGKTQSCLHGHHWMTARLQSAPPPAVAGWAADAEADCALAPAFARLPGYSHWHDLPPPLRPDTVVLRI